MDVAAIAKKMNDDLFELGSDLGKECHRIAFKLGHYGDESDGGGMCRESMLAWFAKTLNKHLPPTEQAD